jgi:adenylate kinase family enzyme
MDARELCEAAELKMTADAALHLRADDAELTRRLPRAAPEHRSDDTAGIIAQRLALYQAAEVGVPQRHAVRAATYRPASQPR